MYSMSSTPLTCCSIGAAIVWETSSAPAPGNAQSIWIVGGVTYGYCVRGNVKKESAPARVMSTERTVAKTGRRMKNRENTWGNLVAAPDRGGLRRLPGRFVGYGSLDGLRRHLR